MNLAFPALLIFVLILPGSIFRYTYARGPWGWANPTSMRSISDEIAYSVIIAMGLHVSWIALSEFLGHPVDTRLVLSLLIGNFGANSQELPAALAQANENRGWIAFYFLSLYAGASVLGGIGHWIVRTTALDHSTPLFRFENRWYYLLTGEILAVKDGTPVNELPDGVYVSAVIDQGKESYLYWGFVEDFTFAEDGDLDCLILSETHRRRLSDDRPTKGDSGDATTGAKGDISTDGRFYEVRGDFLVLRYAEIRTLNLDYFWVEEEESIDGPADQPTSRLQRFIAANRSWWPMRV